MASGGTVPSSDNMLFYSIQRTYIIKPVFMPDKLIFTCDERIDIPTIEPLTYVDPVVYPGHRPNVVPCIEITATRIDLDGINLTFETNEGVTVLPVKIASGTQNPLGNPYIDNRYVLVLPRGTTGIKTCKIIVPELGEELQHNFTFGIMPPPYNYDNALFGYISYRVENNSDRITKLEKQKTYYGYIRNNGSHTIDFSNSGSTFIIKPDTRFIVFFVRNASSENVSFEITLTSVRDENIHTKSTIILPSGRSTVKIDLQSLEMYVMSADNIAKNVYNISGIQDSNYGGIKFGYNHNQSLTGNVEVHEWA